MKNTNPKFKNGDKVNYTDDKMIFEVRYSYVNKQSERVYALRGCWEIVKEKDLRLAKPLPTDLPLKK